MASSTKRRRAKAAKPGRLRRWALRLSLLAVLATLVLAGYMAWLDVQLRERLDDRQYQLPARVFARALVLRQGMALRPDELQSEFAALNYKQVEQLSGPGQWARKGMQYQIWRRGFIHADKRADAARVIFRLRNDELSQLRGENAAVVSTFRLDAASIGTLLGGGDDRNPVYLDNIPPLLGATLIAVEDQDFVHHLGISPRAIVRAMVANFKAAGVVQGGSTITQQLVKNIFFDHKQNLWRKFNEALMALLMEVRYDKAYILQEYINEVWLGQQGSRAIYGFGLASEFYFQKPLDRLAPDQIALLVGLAKGASYYNPWRNPERALKRRNIVLDVMLEQKLITPQEHKQLRVKPLQVTPSKTASQNPYPAFTERLLQELRPYYSQQELRSAGLRIYTTLAPSVQKLTENAVSRGTTEIENSRGIQAKSLQGAAVVLDNINGDVLAMVGDRRAHYPGFNRALDARRQIGSLIKPAVYLTALERTHQYNLATLIDDAPLRYETDNKQIWAPSNFSRRNHGQVPLYVALSKSYNQATARLGLELGLENVRQTMRRLGVQAKLPRVPAMLLGAVELTPFEVAGMFQTIANSGEHVEPRTLLAVSNAKGGDVQYFRRHASHNIRSVPAYLIRYGMEQALREGTGHTAYQHLPKSVAFAGKTGTTNDYRDSWFAGFSPSTTAVVWLGRDDNQRTSLTGATGALPIWVEIMRKLPQLHGHIQPPPGVVFKTVNKEGQYMDPRYCQGGRKLPFSTETQLTPAPGCQGRKSWFRSWFGGEEEATPPTEEMTPGWGVDPQRQPHQAPQFDQQKQAPLRKKEEPQPNQQLRHEPQPVPIREAQPWPPQEKDQWP
ncbi:MAG: penicillin-binding protein 1B [Gammaproteobacteria bacterium]|nr:penicillin-binding protein 1B [Gammaproteobacteria bacterium]